MPLQIVSAYRDDGALRASFNALSGRIFGLDFEPWYRHGFWSYQYEPWSVVEDGTVVANISVNHIEGTLDGQARHYIQLGTVMTAPEARGRGHSRRLMEQVLSRYAALDGIFLYANDSVLDFYPKFGFTPAGEARCHAPLRQAAAQARPVPMSTQADWDRFLLEKRRLRSAARLKLDADGLLMFYLSQFMQNTVYYLQEEDTYIIAGCEEDTLTVYDVFSPGKADLHALLSRLPLRAAEVCLAFPPEDPSGFSLQPYREPDTTLFLLGEAIRRDLAQIGAFPALCHA